MLPTLFGLLAANQEWFSDMQPWVDFNFAQGALFNGGLTGEQWAQIGVAGADLAGRSRWPSACGW